MTDAERLTAKAVVVGAGPSGLLAAIALADGGIETALVGKPAPADHRTTALMSGSVTALETLGVWELCRDAGRAASHVAHRRRHRAPPARAGGAFRSGGDRPARLRLQYREPPSRRGAGKARARFADDHAHRRKRKSGRRQRKRRRSFWTAARRLSADADCRRRRRAFALPRGRRHRDDALGLSAARADIQHPPHATASRHLDRIPYRKRTLHARSLAGPALEHCLRRRSGRSRALARSSTTPRSRMRSKRARIRSLEKSRSIPAAAFSRSRSKRRQSFAARRIALVGEAAHRLPPIGAQGLNLGLRDAATIAELAVQADRAGGDIGGPEVLSRYDTQRRADVTARNVRRRSPQSQPVVGFPSRAGRARLGPLSDEPDRAACGAR